MKRTEMQVTAMDLTIESHVALSRPALFGPVSSRRRTERWLKRSRPGVLPCGTRKIARLADQYGDVILPFTIVRRQQVGDGRSVALQEVAGDRQVPRIGACLPIRYWQRTLVST
jgi:hypothetical protein